MSANAKILPLWFQKWISRKKLIRYKDLLIPLVQFKVITSTSVLGKKDGVNVGFSINGKDVYGNILVFPYHWSQGLTTDALFWGFEEKLSRYLNMIAKGTSRGTPQQLKSIIDSSFQINCLISPRLKKVKSSHIILKGNSLGQILNQKGQVVGMSGTVLATALARGQSPMAYAKSLSSPKKKKKTFNPSRR